MPALDLFSDAAGSRHAGSGAAPPLDRRRFSLAAAAAGAAALAGPGPRSLATGGARQLAAGAAEIVATPAGEQVFLIGPMKPSAGVHDDLYVRALVLADDARRVAIITLDYLGFDILHTRALRAAAAKALDAPLENVLLNCGHTHGAPLTAPWGPHLEHRSAAFFKTLPDKVAQAARQARDKLVPARARFRREPTQIGFNRRFWNGQKIVMAPNPAGPVLPWVDVLLLETPQGRPLAVLFCHAAHPVIVHETSDLITADYPGFAVQTLKRGRRDDAVYLFAQGCAGNINAFPLKGGFDAAAAAGRDLGEAVGRALDRGPEDVGGGAIRMRAEEPMLPLQAPPSVEQCREWLENEQRADRRARFADLLAIAASGQPRHLATPISGLALGDLGLLALAHEPFAEYHLHVNEICPFRHNMVLGYTNGLESYLGTRRDYELGENGGYETSPRGAPFMFAHRLPPHPGCEPLIRDHLATTLRKLKG